MKTSMYFCFWGEEEKEQCLSHKTEKKKESRKPFVCVFPNSSVVLLRLKHRTTLHSFC